MIVKPIIKQCKNHSCTKDTTENPSARFECQALDPSNEILTTKFPENSQQAQKKIPLRFLNLAVNIIN